MKGLLGLSCNEGLHFAFHSVPARPYIVKKKKKKFLFLKMLVYKFRQLYRGATAVLRGVNAMQSGWAARSERWVLELYFRQGVLLTGMTQAHGDPQEGDPLGTITLNHPWTIYSVGKSPTCACHPSQKPYFIFFASVGEEMDAITIGPRKSNIH